MHPSYDINVNHTVKSLYMQVMHGGLFSEDNITLDDIRKVDRNRQPPETGRPKLRYKPINCSIQNLQKHWYYNLAIFCQELCANYSGRTLNLSVVGHPVNEV